MIGLSPASVRGWLLAVVVTAGAAATATVLAGLITLSIVTRDPNDSDWEALGDGVAAGMIGVLVGTVVAAAVFGVSIKRLLGSSRGPAAIAASILVVALTAVLVALFDDGAGDDDVVIAWLALPAIVVAQWAVLRILTWREGAGALVAVVSLMVLAGAAL